MKILEYTKKLKVEFNPMERYNKKQLSWITTGLMILSCVLGTFAYIEHSAFLLAGGWLFAFISGQFYFIVSNWNDLKEVK